MRTGSACAAFRLTRGMPLASTPWGANGSAYYSGGGPAVRLVGGRAAQQHAVGLCDASRGDFDALIVMPYLHSITVDAMWAGRERLVLWPCLHDERFAFMEPYRVLLESAWGVVFISPEEADLALRGLKLRLARSAVMGSGVDVSPAANTDAGPGPAEPYLLYLGRLDHGKNVPLLYDYMGRYGREDGGVRLVVAGSGPCPAAR